MEYVSSTSRMHRAAGDGLRWWQAKYDEFRRGNESEFDEFQSQQRDLEISHQGLKEAHRALTAEKSFLLNLLDQ